MGQLMYELNEEDSIAASQKRDTWNPYKIEIS